MQWNEQDRQDPDRRISLRLNNTAGSKQIESDFIIFMKVVSFRHCGYGWTLFSPSYTPGVALSSVGPIISYH